MGDRMIREEPEGKRNVDIYKILKKIKDNPTPANCK